MKTLLVPHKRNREIFPVSRTSHPDMLFSVDFDRLIHPSQHLFFNLKKLVEADGIEPTTSCLQSTRSPD